MIPMLDYTLSLPPHFQFQACTQSNLNSVTRVQGSSFSDRINSFFVIPKEAPEYGYQNNVITGIGFLLMSGAQFSVSIYNCSVESTSMIEQTILKTAAFAVAFLTLPVTLVGILLKIVGSNFPDAVEKLTSEHIAKTAPHKIDQIYALLKETDKLLREHQINYSADGGTLLGLARHKGIIPWDDDADIIIMHKDKKKFIALKDKFENIGITLQDTGLESFKLTFNKKTLQEKFGISNDQSVNLDIFLMSEDVDHKIRPISTYFKHLFPNEYFLKEELDNLQDHPFGPSGSQIMLKGPANPTRYLDTSYGEWRNYAIQTHSHIQVGPFSVPILNLRKTKYLITNPTPAEGNLWKSS